MQPADVTAPDEMSWSCSNSCVSPLKASNTNSLLHTPEENNVGRSASDFCSLLLRRRQHFCDLDSLLLNAVGEGRVCFHYCYNYCDFLKLFHVFVSLSVLLLCWLQGRLHSTVTDVSSRGANVNITNMNCFSNSVVEFLRVFFNKTHL